MISMVGMREGVESRWRTPLPMATLLHHCNGEGSLRLPSEEEWAVAPGEPDSLLSKGTSIALRGNRKKGERR